MLKYDFLSVSLSKLGNSEDENEDSILEASKSEVESGTIVRFAISDGATESSFSKEWSKFLVCAYKNKPFDKEHLPETLKSISETWQSEVSSIDLPWYAQQKADIGAFATFLGVTINQEKMSFEAVAIGDCTLFQIRNEELIFSFPISSVEDFGNTPNLFASNWKYQPELEKGVLYCNKDLLPEDILLLATDALSAWIFKHEKIKEKPWNRLISILGMNDYKTFFEEWLSNQRENNEIKNDDVTLLIIKFEK
jgi:serine/threonine protein phosphatase PrpC